MTAQDWTHVLRRNELFRGMTDTLLGHLGAALEERRVPAGSLLVEQGDDADQLFVIVEGKLDVFLDTMRLQELGPGSIVGEVALLAGGKRNASVRATEPTRALMLSRERFDRLVEEHPELANAFSSQVQQRMRRVQIAKHLEDLFGKLDADTLAQIESEVQWKQLRGGEVLFRHGDPPDGAYIVAVGRLRVTLPQADGCERLIDEVGPGQWIGEMALITRKERSATVFAVRDSQLVWLSQDVFERLVVRQPRALLEASRLLVTRLQRQMSGTREDVTPELRTLAIVSASPSVDASALAAQLVAQLGGFGSVLYLTSERVDALLGKPGIACARDADPTYLRLAPWLIEQETRHRFTVYQADREWTPWTERAIRSADQILIVVDGRDPPAPGAVEQQIDKLFAGGRAPRRSLVLLHEGTAAGFPGTTAWLRARTVDNHFHVRRAVKGDIARLARILNNQAIGVVFGGGGSRGYAHIGVVRAFEELGIPIDAVGGSSIGAVIAGAYAIGMDWREMLRTAAPVLARFLDPTLPFVSLMSGKRATLGVEEVAGHLDIEDLVTTFFCMSTNLTRGGPVIHRTGNIARAARASGSVPGIFPPVPWDGDLLVDGGLSNNLPVDVMRSMIGGAVVAVDVIPDVDLRASGDDLPNYLSGWSYAWRKVNPFKSAVGMPNILSILMRSMMVASKDVLRAEEQLTALYLRPPVNKWNVLDFKSAEPIAEQGYRATIDQIKAWWATARKTHIVEIRPAASA